MAAVPAHGPDGPLAAPWRILTAPPAPRRPLQAVRADPRRTSPNQSRRRAVTAAPLRQSKEARGGTGEGRASHRKCTPGATSFSLLAFVPPPAPPPRSDGLRLLSVRLPES